MADKKMRGPRVNNKKLIRKLALRTITANPKKNIIVILAIALCTFMFTALFTIGGSILIKFQDSTARQSGGTADASFKYLTEDEYDLIAGDTKIKEISQRIIVGDAVNPELIKLHTEVSYCDEISARKGFCFPISGHLPEKENEAVISSLILSAFGYNTDSVSGYESILGKELILQIDGKNKTFENKFVISGIYTGDRISQAQNVLVSKAFQEKYAPTPTESYYGEEASGLTRDIYGRITAEVDFYVPFNIRGQVDSAVLRDGLPGDVDTGVNWASSTGTMDPTMMLITGALLLTIFLSGYLIINNIYRINVYTDIRSYGLLKTVGTSSSQLRSLVKWQAIFNSVPGIIIGLIGGLLVANVLLPLVMGNLNFSDTTDTRVVFNIWIEPFSALFSYITVRLSVGRAVRLASKVTPIEAYRYSENDKFKGKNRKRARAFDAPGFASRNVFRERKRCFFVVLSLALSVVVLNCVYTLVIGFDEDKYIESYVKTDFSVADAATDNLSVSEKSYDGVTDSFLSELKKQKGIVDIGNVYAEAYSFQELNDRDFARFKERLLDNPMVDTWMRDLFTYDEGSGSAGLENATIAKVYGMDDYAVRNIPVIKGEYDEEKFKTGKYIIVNEYANGGEKISDLVPYFLPGETIAVNNSNGEVREYEVMATVSMPDAIRIAFYVDMDVNYILPSEEFLDFFGKRTPMRTLIDTTDEAESTVENWLSDYTRNVERSLTYSSREVYKKEFTGFTNIFKAVGGLLTAVLSLIGILNLINTIVSSIVSRKLELAMLEAVGMTKSMQRKIIRLEGLIYGAIASVSGVVLSSVFSVLLVRRMGAEMWFFTYKFTLIPVAIVLPIMILVAVIIPDIIYRSAMKETVVERLRLVY